MRFKEELKNKYPKPIDYFELDEKNKEQIKAMIEFGYKNRKVGQNKLWINIDRETVSELLKRNSLEAVQQAIIDYTCELGFLICFNWNESKKRVKIKGLLFEVIL